MQGLLGKSAINSEVFWDGLGGSRGLYKVQLRAKKYIICGLLLGSDRRTRHLCAGTEAALRRRLRVDDTQMAGEADSQKRQTSLESHVGSVRMAFSTIHKVGYKNGVEKKKKRKQTCTAMFSNSLSAASPTCFQRGCFSFPCLKVKSERSFN